MKIGAWGGCHQMAERSFSVGSYQFPVCARCTGVLAGQAVMGICLLLLRPPAVLYCLAGLLVMLVDWLLQFMGILQSTNTRRFITGGLAGCGLIGMYYWVWILVGNII